VVKIGSNDFSVGTWDLFNGIGLDISWNLESSADLQSSNTCSWQNSLILGTPSDYKFNDTVGNKVWISDVALHEGIEEIPFEKLVRDYPKELQLCQRYYFGINKSVDTVGAGYNNFSTKIYAHHVVRKFPVTMRVTPTISFVLLVNGVTNVSSSYINFGTDADYYHIRNGNSSYTATGDLVLNSTADAEL